MSTQKINRNQLDLNENEGNIFFVFLEFMGFFSEHGNQK